MQFSDRSITYDSVEELLRLRATIAQAVTAAETSTSSTRVGAFRKGTDRAGSFERNE